MHYADLGSASRLAAENEVAFTRLREQREQQEAKWKAHCDRLVERDKKIEQMSPDEQLKYMELLALHERRRQA